MHVVAKARSLVVPLNILWNETTLTQAQPMGITEEKSCFDCCCHYYLLFHEYAHRNSMLKKHICRLHWLDLVYCSQPLHFVLLVNKHNSSGRSISTSGDLNIWRLVYANFVFMFYFYLHCINSCENFQSSPSCCWFQPNLIAIFPEASIHTLFWFHSKRSSEWELTSTRFQLNANFDFIHHFYWH